MSEIEQQLKYWKSLALWAIDVHAANPEGREVSCKRLSQNEKGRQIGILDACIQGLNGNFKYHYEQDLTNIKNRCERNKKYYEFED